MHLRRIARAGFVEKRFDADGVAINYVEGPGDGPPLVLIPAQTGTWESYQKVLVPLSRRFHVYAVDVRGHGGSDWTTGNYSWNTVGGDLKAFLERVVRRPALVSGNSSGGLVALWLAANAPGHVTGIVLEDAPLFSAEMPRFRDRDRFVYRGLARTVQAIGNVDHRDLADYFRGTEVPVDGGARVRRIPDRAIPVLSAIIRRPWLLAMMPLTLRLLVRSLASFDPDFARAFVDGRFYEGLDHAEALRAVRCPILILHATWFRHPKWGLVGAMDDDDAARARALVPPLRYEKIEANHVIHFFKPKAFVDAIERFARGEGVLS